ncbi:hypothetical protein POM88_028754 [Heracleum sosnowskyi]|uniref:Uncharacterized protein n=1 Tax=Heracleum sosnowskyi TaxID=360622 RepID=A0AAD8HSU4_9APIA|nr:hypothetical protein POM88_028754 [Heracleum sosnowskyi]
MPSQITREECYSVVNVEDCLVVMAYYREYGELVHVFQLDEERGDWSKTYIFETIDVFLNKVLLCFKYGGEIVCDNGNRKCRCKLTETLEMLEKKEKVLMKKASAESRSGNFQLRLHDQMIMLEGAKATTETVDALRTGASAMKAMQKAT